MLNRIANGFAVLAALGIVLVAASFGSLWVERRGETALPPPTGSFAIGRITDVWTDPATPDPLAPAPGAHRELLVWIWYPAAAGASAAIDDYIPAQMRTAAGPAGGPMSLVTRDAAKVHGHSVRDARVSPQSPAYPVVLMRAGGSGGVVGYSALAEDLASHGYVVVGYDAPYRASVVVFPDGRVLRRTQANNAEMYSGEEFNRVALELLTASVGDTAFVLDRLERLNGSDPSGRFTGRLDMTRVGMFGHSFGGATAAQFCHDDSRCKAGIDLDGQPFGSVIRDGLRQPFMFLVSDHGRADDPESRQVRANIQSIYDRLPSDTRQRLFIRGANHFLFSDDGAVMKSRIILRALRMVGIVGIEGRRQVALTTYALHSFFDAYLKGTRTSQLDLASPLYPELQRFE